MPAQKLGSWKVTLSSQFETESLGQAIGRTVDGGEVLALIGELGAGKTAFVRGVAAGLGVPLDRVSSPTFVLVHEYHGRLPFIHVDLYRLRTETELSDIGLEDYFTVRSVLAIEWADRFPSLLPEDRLEVRLRHKDLETRTAYVIPHGSSSRRLLKKAKTAWRTSHSRSSPRKSRYKKMSAS